MTGDDSHSQTRSWIQLVPRVELWAATKQYSTCMDSFGHMTLVQWATWCALGAILVVRASARR